MEKTHTDITTYKNEEESLVVVVTKSPGIFVTHTDIHRETASGRNECITFNPCEIHTLAEVFNDMIKEGLV